MPDVTFTRPAPDVLEVQLAGTWNIRDGLPDPTVVQKECETGSKIQRLTFDTQQVTDWDSSLLTFLVKLNEYCTDHSIESDPAGLPKGAISLLDLAFAVPAKKGIHREPLSPSLLRQVGEATIATISSIPEVLAFLGESVLACFKLLIGKASYRRSDFVLTIQECGAQALPIVSLISLLMGLILAFVGAVQLRQFGAQLYVADLVGLAMTREMAAIMTGIILAGRTGAAFAAQLGTMTVNEEIDALRTFGISPMEFLVMPRMVALALMMPLLCVYADLMGILGGAIVGIGMLDLTPTQYFNRTMQVIGLDDIFLGVFKGAVFGILVALSGCLRGMQCGRSSAAVGLAATSAVVTAIVLIIVTDAIFAVVTNIVGI